MERIINSANIKRFAYVNDGVCALPVKGIVISFFGLNDVSMFHTDTVEGEFYGENGILYVVPYANPWAWMNRQTVDFVDEIIDVLISEFGLNDNIPIVSSGGSMGGQSALVYCVYAKRTPACCVVNCPVCDVVYHYTERDDIPRTMYSALGSYNGSLENALKSISPLHLIEKMPRIDYHIFHCDADKAVNIKKHSDRFFKSMCQAGHSISFDIEHDRGHCNLSYANKKLYAAYILDAIENRL